MTNNAKTFNNTAALRLCAEGTTNAIQRKKFLVWIALFLAMTLCLFTSCEKEIEFNGTQTDPKLVINSLVEAGQPVKAYISKSYFFLDNDGSTQVPDGVTASLYVNDNLVGEMRPFVDTLLSPYEWGDDTYLSAFGSDYCPQVGDVVKIVASAPGFDEVEATTSPLPNPVDCHMDAEVTKWDSYYTQPYYDGDVYENDSVLWINGYMDLTITLVDPNPGQTDLFRFHLNGVNHMYSGENMKYVSFDYDDPIFGASLDNEFVDFSDLDSRPEGVFTDVLFDGKEYQIKVKDLYFEMQLDEEYDPEFFRFSFRMEHLSKEYYNYLYTCNQGDEIASQLYSEPIQTFSNVEGGYGIVGGHKVDTLWLDLPLQEP